jgi:hypothetical protein
MGNEEFVQFLKSTLIKIENAINLVKQDAPKHIPAYNKILGVQQKLAGLEEDQKFQLFSQLVTTRSIINYFMNGRYGDGYKQILKLKIELVNICLSIEKNERDKNG